jgi:WD40 repeat protein
LIWELIGHDGSINSVVFTGAQIISGSDDWTIQQWNVTTGELIGEPLHGHDARVTSVAVSPDGTLIASASHDCTIRMWDLKTGASIGKPHGDDVTAVTFSPDGTKIASCSDDRTIRLWGAKTQAMIGNPFEGHTDPVAYVAFSRDGVYLCQAPSIVLFEFGMSRRVSRFVSHSKNTPGLSRLLRVPPTAFTLFLVPGINRFGYGTYSGALKYCPTLEEPIEPKPI